MPTQVSDSGRRRALASRGPSPCAAGGTAPYTWSLVSGSLPAGITLSAAGVVGGNTAATGTFSFNVQAADSQHLTATAPLSLTINSGSGGSGGSGGSSISWTTYTYDGIGRTLSVTQPDGASTTTYSYSGNQTTVTDPAGNGKIFTSDVEGNLTTVVEPDPANPPLGTLTTSYAYDWMKHVSQVAMTRGATTQTRTFVYSDAGLLTSATNPENGTVTYTYSSDDTLQYKHDAKGQDTVYTYDNKKRVTEVQRYPTGKNNAEDTCQQVTYSYETNPYSSTFSQNAKGRLTAMKYYAGNCPAGVGQSITEMYSYNPQGQVLWKSLQPGTATAQSVEYSYDGAGRVTYMGYPSPGLVELSYAYDGMGRPSSLVVPSVTAYLVQNAQYDLAGRMTSMQYATVPGVPYAFPGAPYTQETMTYNVNGQLASLNWGAAPGSTGYTGPAGGIQYSYSATQNNGQITQALDTLSGETIGYLYDALKRLTSAASTPTSGSSTAPWTQTFQYDGFGNLTAKVLNGTTTPIAVNTPTNQLSSAYYDANGNMTSGAGATLTYDVSNRLASAVETSGGIEYYAYAPDNKRVFRQMANGHQLITLYGAQGEKLSDFDLTAGTWVATYVWFGGKLISDGNAVYEDRLGTNRASGARFMPFGDEITSTANDHVKFGTYTRDSYTGLDYADQRFYASSYGRFNTPDPFSGSATLTDPSSWNRFVYVEGDPVNSYDPNGLDSFDGITPLECQIYDINNECETLAAEYGGGGGSLVGQPVYDTGATFSTDVTDSAGSDPSAGSGDPDPGSFDLGDSEPAPPAPVTVGSCVTGSAALGSAIGAGILGPVFAGIGIIGGAAGGSLALPGGGTIAGGVIGGELGTTGGTLAGGALGGFVGGALGNIFCAEHTNNPTPSNRPKHEKGKRRKKISRGPSTHPKRPPNKRPPNWPGGPWPPGPGKPWW